MKSATYIAFIAAAVPAVWSLPSGLVAKQFKVPTCAAESCLTATNGTFDGVATNNLGGICQLPQDEVTRYVETVQPCIDGDAGQKACTDGARFQYKDLLESVCGSDQFGKDVQWA